MTNTKEDWALYNMLDSAVTYEICDKIWSDLEKQGYAETYAMTEALFPVATYMMERGIKVDFDALSATKKEVNTSIAEKEELLKEQVGFALNVESPKQVQNYFYGVLGIKPYINRKTGRPTTDDKAMARIARKGSKAAKLVQELRSLAKLSGTYLEIDFDPDGRMRCSINLRGTKNGRFSTSKTLFNTGMNMQNLPPAFKRFLVADENYFFMEFDKRNSEWVATAYIAQDELMIDVVKSGKDPHAATGMLISGAPLDLVLKDHELIGHMTDEEEIARLRKEHLAEELLAATERYTILYIPRSMSIRQAGKKSNHGLNYGMMENRFSLENEIEVREAKRMVELYHHAYVNLRAWYEQVKSKLSKDRTLTNCFGRKRRFLEPWGQELFMAAYSFEPQSTSVDALNKGIISVYNDVDDYIRPIEILAQVHDSVLVQFPVGRWNDATKVVHRIKDYMNIEMECNKRKFTIETDLKVGVNWGDYGAGNPGGMKEIPITGSLIEMSDMLESAYGKAAR